MAEPTLEQTCRRQPTITAAHIRSLRERVADLERDLLKLRKASTKNARKRRELERRLAFHHHDDGPCAACRAFDIEETARGEGK